MINYRFLWAKVFILLLFIPTLAQPVTINIRNTWSGIFAGEVVPYEITLTGKPNSYISIGWKLNSKGRTLSSGQQTVRFNRGDAVTVTLLLRTPALKPGIKLEAQLIIKATNEAYPDQNAHNKFKLVIYGPDLLLENKHFYQQLNVQLFDPIGTTSKILDKLKIPYDVLSKSQLINSTKKGLIIVGAGVALDQQRGLINTLLKDAGNGRRVLILQPVSGDFPISDLATETNVRPSEIAFKDDSIVQSFAKGYDWNVNAAMKKQGISLINYRQVVLAQIGKFNNNSWDWLQINFDRSGGKIIICMLPFERYIDYGPIPQVIFSRLLAHANGQLPNSL